VEMDSVSHNYRVISESIKSEKRFREAAEGILLTTTNNVHRPYSSVDVNIHFQESVDLNQVSIAVVDVFHDCDPPCIPVGFSSNWLSPKIIDQTGREINYTIDGLEPSTKYQIRVIVNIEGNQTCHTTDVYSSVITAPRQSERKKKLLFVVDKEWENNGTLSQALQTYSHDVSLTDTNIVFDYYYIGTSLAEKKTLYDYVKQNFFESDLAYLFFIGRNAAVPIATAIYDENNQVVNYYRFLSFTHYSFPRYSAYEFNNSFGEFVVSRTRSLCNPSETEKMNPVFQQSGGSISIGMILPDISYNFQTKTDRVLGYFDKLHRYKNYEFEFDKRVLITDGFVSDRKTVTLAEQNGRWYAADSVNVGHTKDLYFSGNDQIWKDDYLQKLQDNSYEILTYNGHGSSSYHSFGIHESDIVNLSSLNTQFINFSSCNVGNFRDPGYLANKYLETGKVLAVHAYSDLLYSFTSNGESTLTRAFDKFGAFDYMSKGYRISDAFRHFSGYSETDLLLGDPLLTLRKSCDPIIQSQTSGDWYARSTWTCGRIPTKEDIVQILPGHTITLRDTGQVRDISIEGKLELSESGQLAY